MLQYFAESWHYKHGHVGGESQNILTPIQLKFYLKKKVNVIPDRRGVGMYVGIYKNHETKKFLLLLTWKDIYIHISMEGYIHT